MHCQIEIHHISQITSQIMFSARYTVRKYPKIEFVKVSQSSRVLQHRIDPTNTITQF